VVSFPSNTYEVQNPFHTKEQINAPFLLSQVFKKHEVIYILREKLNSVAEIIFETFRNNNTGDYN